MKKTLLLRLPQQVPSKLTLVVGKPNILYKCAAFLLSSTSAKEYIQVGKTLFMFFKCCDTCVKHISYESTQKRSAIVLFFAQSFFSQNLL